MQNIRRSGRDSKCWPWCFPLAIPASFKFVFVTLLAAFIAACSMTPVAPPKEAEPWQAPEWTAWRLTGRISVKYLDDGWNAGLIWRQSSADYDLKLQGPLGQGALLLHGNEQSVELVDANGGRDTALDAETLMHRHLGWQLPLSGMKFWIHGRSNPAQPAEWRRDVNGRPEQLIQSGWQIDYSKYRPAPGGASLPARIDFERPDLQARLIIDHWEILADGGVAGHESAR